MSKKSLAAFFALFFGLTFTAFARTESVNNPYLNERFVVNALRQIQNAQMNYRETVGAGNFGTFSALRQANLIDAALASLQKYGYSFSVNVMGATGGSSSLYHVTAVPQRYRKTGRKSFYIDERCEIRGADKNGAAADAGDPIIENCAPSMLAENERQAIESLRAIHNAQATYQAAIGNGNFGTLTQLQQAGLISQSLGFNFYRGYFRAVVVNAQTAGNPSLYYVQVVPETYGRTGVRSFYVNQTGIIRGADRGGQPANQNDPPIELGSRQGIFRD